MFQLLREKESRSSFPDVVFDENLQHCGERAHHDGVHQKCVNLTMQWAGVISRLAGWPSLMQSVVFTPTFPLYAKLQFYKRLDSKPVETSKE